MRLTSLFLLMLIVLSCHPRTRLRSKDNFANLYIEALKKANPKVTFVLNSDLTITSKKDDLEFKHFIDNAYADYRSVPDDIEEIINKHVAFSSEAFVTPNTIAMESIVPLIKPKEYLDDFRSAGGNPDSMIFEKYNDQLIIVYSEESEKSIKTLSAGRFKSLGISMDSLRKIALGNLDRIIPLIKREGEEGSYTIAAGGDYEVSLILISSFWTKETFPVDGEFIIAIPTRDNLFVTGSNNRPAIERIRRIAMDEYNKGRYIVSEHLYKWTGNKFQKYE